MEPKDTSVSEVHRPKSSPRSFCYNPGKLHAELFSRFPVLMVFIQAGLILLLTYVTVYFYGPPNFDDASRGIEARGTPIHDRVIPLENILTEREIFSPTPTSDLDINSAIDPATAPPLLHQSKSLPDLSAAMPSTVYTAGTPPIPFCGNPEGSSFGAVYVPSSYAEELLDVESLRSMCQQDDTFVRNSSTYDNVCNRADPLSSCCPTWSVPNYISALSGRSSCHDLTAADVAYARDLLLECAPYYTSGNLQAECGSGVTCPGVPTNCTTYNAIYAIFYGLTPSDFSTQITETGDLTLKTSLQIVSLAGSTESTEAKTLYLDAVGRRGVDNGITRIEAIGTNRIVKFTVISGPLMTDSILLGVAGIAVFFILWIYLQCVFIAFMVLLEIVFSLLLAYFLYFVVCRLTFFAFGNMLSVAIVLGVGADDAFIFYDIYVSIRTRYPDKDSRFILEHTMKEAFPTMFVTSLTTASALFMNATGSITAIRLYGVYAGLVILCNFLFTMTWSPAILVIYDRYTRRRTSASENITTWTCLKTAKNCWMKMSQFTSKLFTEYLPWLVFTLSYLWLIVFTLLSTAAFLVIFWRPQLKLPSSNTEFQVFTLRHPLEMYDQVFRPQFDIEKATLAPLQIIVVWGVIPVDNGSPWSPEKRGFIQLDDTFNLDDPQSQVWLLEFCSSLRQQGFYQTPTHIYEDCFIEGMKSMMEAPCIPDSLGSDLSPCCNQTLFPYSTEIFKTCAPRVAALRCQPFGCPPELPGLRFDANNNTVAFFVQFQSTALSQLEFASVKEYYDVASAWVAEQVKTAPAGLQGGWFGTITLAQPYYIDLLIHLSKDAPLSLGLSLAIAAFVLLITNRNALIALYAVLSIGGAVILSVAIFVLMGWPLDVFESGLIVLSVGLATDFTIHYGVAYRLAPHPDRSSRARHSLSTLASANTMAALSSFIVGALVLPADVLIFVQLGIALDIVIVCSWLYGTFFFMSLCYVAGPEENVRLIRCCLKKSDVVTTQKEKPVTPVENFNRFKLIATGRSYQQLVAVDSNWSLMHIMWTIGTSTWDFNRHQSPQPDDNWSVPMFPVAPVAPVTPVKTSNDFNWSLLA
ncbi:protein dispatched homolog 1-like [Diadema setosum]|uniref:protein dispatched homolog 1-like n=1 Tax=Diadema setosum TaxID=31175 RepID=UPI003B3BD83C